MKALCLYLHMVLFVKYVVLTFESVDEMLWCDHSNESSLPVLTPGAICFSKFHKMKFGNLVEICFWLNLSVKGLRTPLCKLIIWYEEDLPGPLLIGQRCMKSYHWPRQLDGTFFEPDELKEVYFLVHNRGCHWLVVLISQINLGFRETAHLPLPKAIILP